MVLGPAGIVDMLTLLVVLTFPLLLGAGYTVLFLLSGRNVDTLTGPAGFLLYVLLVTIPAAFVLATHPGDLASAAAWRVSTLLWLLPAPLVGIALWGVQRWGLPGKTPEASERVWVGPAGPGGFALLLIPVGYIVLAEELVWRAYLVGQLGLPLSAAAFALHHYFFGLRHVVFAFIAGLVWGVLFALSESLWPGAASHFVYNALAWRHMRQSSRSKNKLVRNVQS